ncbi:type II toxin-antitoxin system HicB family antitoxin [Paractinoplanes globisporus]|uniref:Type II toxin-antitoxin system HicB family antitoxin n=1 Tax=Paractinoplanes globisporus TaxID=113565 RepID=A0ABW6WIC0_9ACTN|nr:type II toxin-antitoxin system HicB family antitoxin [Actinoplanes globisporus]
MTVVVERDDDGVWCARARSRPGPGAHGEGSTEEEALADLRDALTGQIEDEPGRAAASTCDLPQIRAEMSEAVHTLAWVSAPRTSARSAFSDGLALGVTS